MRGLVVRGAFSMAVLFSMIAAASESMPIQEGAARHTLSEILENARNKNSELSSMEWKAKLLELEAFRVNSEFAPKVKAMVGVGPTTGVTGNALSSVSEGDTYGLAFISSIELTWPLWTWGREGKYLSAIRSGGTATRAEVDEKWLEISAKIKEAYYGFLLAKTLLDLIDESIEKVESSLPEKGGDKDKRLKIEILLGKAKQKRIEIQKGLNIARMGLRIFGGYDSAVEPAQDWLTYKRKELKPVSYYLEKNRQHPKFRQIQLGLSAKNSLIQAEERGLYPVVGLLAQYKYSNSSVRENQQSTFAYDPFNQSEALIGVGLQWDYQWGQQDAKIQKLRAESSQLKAQEKYARSGLPGLVQKAWYEVQSAQEVVSVAKKAQKAGKRWLNRRAMSAGTGLGKVDTLIEAFTARVETRKDYLEAIYQFELAWAALEKSVGAPVTN